MNVRRGDPSPLKVLVAHNAYQQRGGEDAVVDAEIALLRDAGHAVIEYRRHNDDVSQMSPVGVAIDTVWSRRTQRDMGALLIKHRPDVVHVHNTFPLISPSLYESCAEHRVPVVQTLHNFRLACPSGSFLREGRLCEQCLGRTPWPAVVHGCYRGSRPQTAVVATSLSVHRWRGTLRQGVHRYIALSSFSRDKYVEMGLPSDRLVVKPNFVPDPGLSFDGARHGLLYAGRLSQEKGIDVLARALSSAAGLEITVAGTGPDDQAIKACAGARLLGAMSAAAVMQAMATRVALVLPSVCYEGFPRTLVEAFSTSTPVIASRIGALAELVQHGVTGLLVPPNNPDELATAMRWALDNPRVMREMGERARQRYLAAYTPEHNLPRLLAIYAEAQAESGRLGPSGTHPLDAG